MGKDVSGVKARPVIKAVRGTRDLLPNQTPLWNHVEATARAVFARYGFGEIRTPIFEATELFARGVGEETDIVSKEMFTWLDRAGFVMSNMKESWRQSHTQYLLGEPTNAVRFDDITFDYDVQDWHGVRELVVFRDAADPWFFQKLEAISESQSQPTRVRLVVPEDRVPDSLRARISATNNRPYAAADSTEPIIEPLAGNFSSSAQSLTLRPESTAGVVRAYIEHKLGDTGELQKLYYIGPQFRRERPQKGRYRQFWQIGAEVIGSPSSGAESPLRDAEVLEMLASLLDELGVRGWRLELNSVGNAEDRARYTEALRGALAGVKDRMCPDNQRRAETNPLRVLDSKDEGDQEIINGLPKIADYLGDESRTHFSGVLAALDACGVPYHINPRLVRGLDYYTRTTFEFTVDEGLGAQNALLGGGRYDGLSEILGGPRAPGIGFAIGEDRLVLTLGAQAEREAEGSGGAQGATKMDAYVAPLGVGQNAAALALARELRRGGLTVELGDGAFKLRKSFEVADRLARHIVLLGEDEVRDGVCTVKTFATGEQRKVAHAELVAALR